MRVILGGNFTGGNCRSRSYPGWEFSLVGVFPDGNCPVGIIRVAIFRMGDYMLPNKHTVHMNEIKTKTKPSHVTFKLTTRSNVQFSQQKLEWYH